MVNSYNISMYSQVLFIQPRLSSLLKRSLSEQEGKKSLKAGLRSSNFLKLVMDGVRNLSKDSIMKMAKGFSLTKEELDFFENLVFMNQAKTNEEKNYYYHKLSKAQGYLKIKRIEKDYYEYYSHWYNPAIRELIAFKEGKITPEEIAKILIPPVTLSEVKKSLKLLVKLGFITQEKTGFKQQDPHITTAQETQSMMIKNYHGQMLNLAIQSMDNFPADKRDISSVTVAINEEQIKNFKERLSNFRNELLNESDQSQGKSTVMQINLQMFPLTKILENGHEKK